jgi:predicted nucleic acid-binding protein
MIHLDTNFLITALQEGTPQKGKIRTWLSGGESLNVNTVVWAEFFSGPLSDADEGHARSLFAHPETFTAADAELAAGLFNKTGRRSRSLADCMIAATAIRCQAKLATVNSSDFILFTPHGLTLA